MIYLDFETFSELNLKKVGAHKYAEHHSTRILCMAYRLPGETETSLWLPTFEAPQALFDIIEEGELVEAHNAEFEWLIWNIVGQKHHGFNVNIDYRNMRDTAAYAAAHAMPRDLKRLAKALKVKTQKDEKGHRIMLKLSQPRTPTKNNPSTRHDKFEDYEALYDYCITDVDAEKDCSDLLPELNSFEQQIWELDKKINRRGIYCDLEVVDIALDFIQKNREKLIDELRDLTDGAVTTAAQTAKLLKWFRDQDIDVDSVAKDNIQKIIDMDDIDPLIKRVAEIRKRLAMTSVKKFPAMKMMACSDSRIRGTLLYHGATTGRWAGRGLQPHNMKRDHIKDQAGLFEDILTKDYDWFEMLHDDVLLTLSSALRGCLRAAPGHELMVADYAAIEARVVLWLAGCEHGLELFRKDIDIYKDMAKDIYSTPIPQITQAQRQLGKQAILGLGFGMGIPKFMATCLGYKMDVSEELATLAVTTYREKYYQVKKLWYDLDRAVTTAIKHRGKLVNFRHFQIKVVGLWLYIRLPSGRKLAYFNPQIKRRMKFDQMRDVITFWGMSSQTNQWCEQETYGGKLVENVTQAVARDLMAHAMPKLEEAGYPVVLTVHDEVISEVPEGFGSVAEFENIMASTPKWAKGLPVKAEGWRGIRYRK